MLFGATILYCATKRRRQGSNASDRCNTYLAVIVPASSPPAPAPGDNLEDAVAVVGVKSREEAEAIVAQYRSLRKQADEPPPIVARVGT